MKTLFNYFRRLNESLPGLVAGIVLYGVVIEILVLIFSRDRLGYSIGLWYGAMIGIGMAVNLASVIYDTVSLGDSDLAQKRAVAKSILRYVVVVILFFLLGLFEFGNLLMALVGVMGLKVSAYLQPALMRFSSNIISKKNDKKSKEVRE